MAEDRDRAGGVTEAPARREREQGGDRRADRLPPYRVLLHNDDHNQMLDVVETIVELTPHPRHRSVEIMLAAHTRGVALVVVTHKERAELYRDQFASKGLTVTIEPAEN